LKKTIDINLFFCYNRLNEETLTKKVDSITNINTKKKKTMNTKITASPENADQVKLLKKYCTQRNIPFSVRGENGAQVTKADSTLKAEAEFCAVAGVSRFRMTKEEKASGKTRDEVIAERMKTFAKRPPTAE